MVKINLEPHYRNYWLDLAREEEQNKEKENKKEVLASLLQTINQIIQYKKLKKKKP